MKYIEFKKIFFKLIDKYGFIKEDKIYRFRNEEVMIIFQIDKSQYDNSVSRFGIGINPLDILENWNLPEPSHYDQSRIKYSLTNDNYILLDNITKTEIQKLEDDLKTFFEVEFPMYCNIESLKKMIVNGDLKVSEYICDFWGLKSM